MSIQTQSQNLVGMSDVAPTYIHGDAHEPVVQEQIEDEENPDAEVHVEVQIDTDDNLMEETILKEIAGDPHPRDVDTEEEGPDLRTDEKEPSQEITMEAGESMERNVPPDEPPPMRPEPKPRRGKTQQTDQPLRRSERERRRPVRYESYQVSQVTTSQWHDSKLQALETLMSSGVLKQCDAEIAHKMVRAMMER